MHSIPEILEDLKQGKMIVLVDDEDRENEGDLVCPAQFCSPDAINFMLREGRGMLCVALSGGICDKLELWPQSVINTSERTTAYTITVDAHSKFGITTGVSAFDRSTTIKRLVEDHAVPTDFARPGHIPPLRARNGGVLVRAGQTEGSVDLCRLAGLKEGAAIIEIMEDDGTMARRPSLEKFCAKHNIKMCSVADLIQYRLETEQLVQRLAEDTLETEHGLFKLIAYRNGFDPLAHVALICGNIGKLDVQGKPIPVDHSVMVRMHSQNLLGDVFGDLKSPSGKTLQSALKLIAQHGEGALVYLRHESAGRGMLQQLQTLNLPPEAQREHFAPQLGMQHPTPGTMPPVNKGAYGIGCQILRDLGIRQIKLLTNHPFQPSDLDGYGLSIETFVNL
jgi:3,4-dihydroxy 2-butanone 4-phosphate synthase/GTP cyclohydrolase II